MLDSFRDTQYKERIVKVEELFAQLRLLEQGKIYIHQIYDRFGPLEEAESAFDDLHDHYKSNQEEMENLQEQVNELKDKADNLNDIIKDLRSERDDLEEELKEIGALKDNVHVFKTKINAAITSDNTSDGEVVDKLMELLNEYL